jgi:HD-GYP domain-containing protein (c-di-GMP phosphodiesterase class II)
MVSDQELYRAAIKPFEAIFIDEKLRKNEAKKVYFRSIAMVKEVCQNLMENKPLPIRKAKRLSQTVVDWVLKDEAALLGLSSIKNYDDYTYNHPVNVSIYSLIVGVKLGFSKKILVELGMASLLHDVGITKIPDAILKKPCKLNEVEWKIVKSHPAIGVEKILEFPELADVYPRILFGIFDHHLNFDLSGYPTIRRRRKQTLFGRIITIADAYDAMTTPRCYRKEPYSAVNALKLMWKECGVHFDPTLFKVFVNAMGIYPIGSMVQLDGDELGIAYKINRPKALKPSYHSNRYQGGGQGRSHQPCRDR